MKSSNLALRLDDDQTQSLRTATKHDGPTVQPPVKSAKRRPRRSSGCRSIVISDQGFAPFRVR